MPPEQQNITEQNENQTSAPVPQPTGYDHTKDEGFQRMIPTQNQPALLAYYFGVFGLVVPFLWIAAIIQGRKGMRLYNQQPTPGAKGHAKAGLILGYIEAAWTLLLILAIGATIIFAK